MDNNEKIDVPVTCIEAFLAVRKTGRTNMLDSTEVVNIMIELELMEAAVWLIDFDRDTPKVIKKKFAALLRAVNDSFKVMNVLSGGSQ